MSDASRVQKLKFTPKKHATSEIYKKRLWTSRRDQ